MSKISQKELEKILESKGVDSSNFPKDDDNHEKFWVASCVRGSGITYKGEELKEGMSYSHNMLDINELMEKNIVGLGDKIDLRNFPEVNTLQVAWQSQLDMLDDASKAQIKSIHLSNNTPVGCNNNFEYDNYFPMDETLDLSDYKNVTQLQTHFYLNNDLKNIILPEGVEEIFCKHSKMANLHATDDVPTFLHLSETADDIEEFGDGMEEYNNYLALKHYSYKKEKNGTYTLCHDGEPVARGFDEEKELRWNCRGGREYVFSDEVLQSSDLLTIIGDKSFHVTEDGKHYQCKESVLMGTNLTKDVYVNSMDENDKIPTLCSANMYSGSMKAAFKRDAGMAVHTDSCGVYGEYPPENVSLYAKHGDDFLVVSEDTNKVTPRLYSEFLNKAKEEGVEISKKQMNAIEANILEYMEFNKLCSCELENLNPYVQKFVDRGEKLIEMRKKLTQKRHEEEQINFENTGQRVRCRVDSLNKDDILNIVNAIEKDMSR